MNIVRGRTIWLHGLRTGHTAACCYARSCRKGNFTWRCAVRQKNGKGSNFHPRGMPAYLERLASAPRRSISFVLWSAFVCAVAGIAGADFLLSSVRSYACPSATFIYGATSLGELATILVWMVAAPFALWAGIDVVPIRIFGTDEPGVIALQRSWSNTVRCGAVVCLLLAALVSPFGFGTGFRDPWRPVLTKQSFILRMKDGTEIDLMETRASFLNGYVALRKALQDGR